MLSAHLWVSGVSREPRPSSVPMSKCSLSCGKGMANLGMALVSQLPRASWGSPVSAKERIASSNWLPCGPAALRSKVTSQGGHAPVTDPTRGLRATGVQHPRDGRFVSRPITRRGSSAQAVRLQIRHLWTNGGRSRCLWLSQGSGAG